LTAVDHNGTDHQRPQQKSGKDKVGGGNRNLGLGPPDHDRREVEAESRNEYGPSANQSEHRSFHARSFSRFIGSFQERIFTGFQKPVFELIAQNCEFYFLDLLESVSPGDDPGSAKYWLSIQNYRVNFELTTTFSFCMVFASMGLYRFSNIKKESAELQTRDPGWVPPRGNQFNTRFSL
jgi:hypothetical protein